MYREPRIFHCIFGNKVWYKHKKAREDRQRSHYDEWEEDMVKYITAEKKQF